MKKIFTFIKTKFFALWILYILFVSASAFFNEQFAGPIIIHATNKSAINYKYIYKYIDGGLGYGSMGVYVDEIYIIAFDSPKNVMLTIEGKNYIVDNHAVFEPGTTQKFIDSAVIYKNEKAFKVIGLPKKKLFRRIEKYPFVKSITAINYSHSRLWLILFSPLLVFSILAYLLKNKFLRLLNFFQSNKTAHFIPIKKKHGAETFLIIILVLLVFLFIEYYTPYYFLQDDNYSQFYPYLINGLNSIYTNHTLPLYNFNQLNGTPNLGYTTYSYFNPILHISYWLCLLFKNKFLLLEIFTYLNLVLGAVFTNFILRSFNIGFCLRLLTIFNIIFSGYTLVVISSWYYVAPYFFFMILLFYLALKIINGNIQINIKSALWIGAICGLFVYGGNIQYWVYCQFFFVLVLVGGILILHRITVKKLVSFLFPLFFISLIISLPIIIVGMIETKDLNREVSQGAIWFSDFWNYIVTIPNLIQTSGNSFLWENQYHFYHIGIVGSIGLAASIIIFGIIIHQKNWLKLANIKKDWGFILFLCSLNIFFLLLSMGSIGIIYRLQKIIPFINKFSLSFKYIIFVLFISNLVGALVVEKFLRLFKQKFIVDLSLLVLLIFFVLFHVKGTNFNLYTYGYDKHVCYDDSWLKADKENISLNKYISFAPFRSHNISYSNSLTLNFATQFNLFALTGYEPLNPKVSNSLVHIVEKAWKDNNILRKMGINRLIIWKEKAFLIQNEPAGSEFFTPINFDSLVLAKNLVFENQIMAIYKIENADPLFFYYKNGTVYKDAKFERVVSGNSLTFRLLSPINADSVVINFDYNPRFIPYLNKSELNRNSIRKDLYNRIVIDANKNKDINLVSIKYSYF